MSGLFVRGLVATLALVGLTGVSLADEWTAVRLRGDVFVYRDGWVKLERGDVVADDSIIRTLGHGRVSFERDAETIDLLPNSQIRIIDQTGRRFTTVMSDYGGVEIDAEVQNVEHFSVATPFLAAVVKGTHFSVSSDDDGSEVSVQRGQVFVEDTSSQDSVTIVAGQTASTSSSGSGDVLIVTDSSASAPSAIGAIVTFATNEPNTSNEPTTSILSPTPSAETSQAPTTSTSTSQPSNSDDSSNETSGPGNDNSGPGNNNGNQNDNSGPGNNNGNQNDNSGPGNNNGNHNGHEKKDK